MSKQKKDQPEIKTMARNRRASAKYSIIETMEAGLVLTGPEVKSIRAGNVTLQDGFVRLENDEAYLWNVHIKPYSYGSTHVEQEPTRRRKILLKKRELSKLIGKTTIKGLTLVPLEIYFNKRGIAKVKVGLAKGKKAPDRRDDIKKRELSRDMRRQFGDKQRIR